jgi:simple sugar transport system ATP-binding protein
MAGRTVRYGRNGDDTSWAVRAAAVAACATLVLTACGSTKDNVASRATAEATARGKVGVILPLLTSPFWQSYNDYVPKMAKSEDVDALKTVNSNSDPSQQITDINNQLNQGVKGLVVAPLDSAAIEAGLDQAERKGVPVVAVDVAPEKGKVAMVVRADNVAYGEKACEYLGKQITSGKVVQIMGDLASVNGRDRSEAFRACVKEKYPKLKVLEIPAKWESDTAASKLDTLLNANPDIKGIYMQAGGVYLAPTLQTLKSKGLLKTAARRAHRDRLERRHPAGVRRDPQGRDRRHRLPAGRPLRQVRHVLHQGRDGGEDLQARPDRPRLHDRQAAQRHPRGPAARAAGHQGQRRRPRAVGQHGQMSTHPLPLVEARGIVKRYGPTVALADGRLTVHAGRVPRPRRPQRRRQVHPRHRPHRPPGPRRGHGQLRRRARARAHRPGRLARKVACVYQKPTVVPELTVAENLFINRQPQGRGGFISWRRLSTEAAEVLDTWDVHVDPEARTADLKVEDRQMVEIARALSFGARFIVLDEPTAQLDNREIERLFTRMRALQESGVTFLFISHHLQEVYEVCQTVTVLRDARWITTAPVADLPRRALVEAMAGESIAERGGEGLPLREWTRARPSSSTHAGSPPSRTRTSTSPSAVVRSSDSPDPAAAARSSWPSPSPGLHTPTGGTAQLDGEKLPFGDVQAALRAGVGCVPRDRHGQGLVFGMTVGDNATMSVLDRLGRYGFVGTDRKRGFADRADRPPRHPHRGPRPARVRPLRRQRAEGRHGPRPRLRPPAAGPDQPHRGRRREVQGVPARPHGLARDDGTAVLVVSDELDDLRRCDRVLVLFHGRVVAEHPAGWRDHELIASIEGVDHG